LSWLSDARRKSRAGDRRVIAGIVPVAKRGCRSDCPVTEDPPTTISHPGAVWGRRKFRKLAGGGRSATTEIIDSICQCPLRSSGGKMGEQKQVAQGGNTQRATVASGLVLFDRDLWGGSGTTLFERRLYLRGDGAIDLGMFAIGINGCNRTP